MPFRIKTFPFSCFLVVVRVLLLGAVGALCLPAQSQVSVGAGSASTGGASTVCSGVSNVGGPCAMTMPAGVSGAVGAVWAPGLPAPSGAAARPGLTAAAPEAAASAEAARGPSSDVAGAATPRADFAPLVPNQFQRFVQDTTGQLLRLYGFNLFGAAAFPSLANVPVPANYVLGPGDDIDIRIWGAVDTSLRLTIDRNGQITIPKVGPVTVAGIAADRLEGMLKTRVGRVYTNFELSATLGRLRSIQIFVVGQARRPGAYTVSSLSTLISALFESGGPAATGSLRQIQLVRGGKTLTTLDLYRFIHGGDTSMDVRLLPGDVIVMPPAGPRVALLGALDNSAIYELSGPEESLAQLLAYSGGVQRLTTPHKVLLERIDPTKSKAPRSVEERRLTPDGLASTVRDGDVVTLFKISPEFADTVTLRGNVAAPLRYRYRPGMRVSDLIPEVEALIQSDYYVRKNIMVQYESGKAVSGARVVSDVINQLDEINWDYASIERLDPKEVRTRLIPFNLARAVKTRDPADDQLLQPGDVITVFGVRELPLPLEKRTQFVRIDGEVQVPGFYQLTSGQTLPDLIARAGGLTRNAFAYGTVFTRESTRVQQQENLNKAIRRLESDINSMTATALQNVKDSDKGEVVQAQIAGQRILLARLQALKASGRIALELDAEAPRLPALVMEDGDQITVPHRPSFVGVFGAVIAETSFMHRPGNTVADYLEKAGVTREAEIDDTLVLRADGTVESAQSVRRSYFSKGILTRTLQPGDSVFVPELIDRRSAYTRFIQGAKDWTTIVYQLGLGAAAIKVLRQ